MASALSGMSVVYDKEGIDPCKCRAVYCTAAHYCECVPVTSFRTGINDDEGGLHHDCEVWLEKVCSRLHPAPHASIDQAGPEAGCTTVPARLVPRESRERLPVRDRFADAHLKRQIMGREVVFAVTNGRLDFGTWERILCQLNG